MEYYLGYPVIALLVVWLPTAFFTSNVTGQRKCNEFLWFLWEFFFGPLALIIFSGMPDRRARKYPRRTYEKLDPENAKSSAKEYFDKK